MSECLKCGGVMKESSRLTFDGEVRDERVTIVMPGLKCKNCGHQTVPGAEMAEFMRRCADAYRSRHALLTSDEIRSRRNSLGMTQEQFADWLSAGVASIRRWELGAVQDAAMDSLIRLKTDPDAAREAAKATLRLLAQNTGLGNAKRTPRVAPARLDREAAKRNGGSTTSLEKPRPRRRAMG